MDKEGVATSVLSCTTPGIWFGDIQETVALARGMNEFAARMISDFKGRFRLFAVLPMPMIEASLREIEYALDTLKADGVGVMTSYNASYLGDPVFRPVFDELNRRKALVYTHPIDAACCQDIMAGVIPVIIEYNTDTARAIISLIAGDAATRYSDIRFVFSHAGGTMTSLIERFGIGTPDVINDNLANPAPPNIAAVPSAAVLLRHGAIGEHGDAGAEEDRRGFADRLRHRLPVRHRSAHACGPGEMRFQSG